MAYDYASDEGGLKKQREQIIAEIKRRGGKDKAPGFASILEGIDSRLSTIRSGGSASGNTWDSSTGGSAGPAPASQPTAPQTQIGTVYDTTPKTRPPAQNPQTPAPNQQSPGPITTPTTGPGQTEVPVQDDTETPFTSAMESRLAAGEAPRNARADAWIDINNATSAGKEFIKNYGVTLQQLTPEQMARSQEMRNIISQMGTDRADARQYSQGESQALAEMYKGMSGYSGQEMQGMREAANANLDQALKSNLYKQQVLNARAGVTGAAALAGSQDAMIASNEAKANIERDLMVKNADEIQARRAAFANTVRATEDARYGRMGAFNQAYADTVAAQDAKDREAQLFNATQASNQSLANSSLGLSGAGIYQSQYNSEQANAMAEKQLEDERIRWADYLKFTEKQNKYNRRSQEKIAKTTAHANQPSSNSTVTYNFPQTTNTQPTQGAMAAPSAPTAASMMGTGTSTARTAEGVSGGAAAGLRDTDASGPTSTPVGAAAAPGSTSPDKLREEEMKKLAGAYTPQVERGISIS